MIRLEQSPEDRRLDIRPVQLIQLFEQCDLVRDHFRYGGIVEESSIEMRHVPHEELPAVLHRREEFAGVLPEFSWLGFVERDHIGERLLIQETNVAREETEDHAHDEVRYFLFGDRMLASRVPRPHVICENAEQVGGFLGEFRLELAGIQAFRVFKQRPKNLERRES